MFPRAASFRSRGGFALQNLIQLDTCHCLHPFCMVLLDAMLRNARSSIMFLLDDLLEEEEEEEEIQVDHAASRP